MAKKIKTCLKWLLAGVALLALGLWLFSGMILRSWEAKPPPVPADAAILKLKPEVREGRVWLGKSWTGRRDGLLVAHLRGSPFEMGYAAGVLMQDNMHTLENEFFEMISGYVPRPPVRELLKDYIVFRNRHLSDFVPLKYRQEIYGASLGCEDIHPEQGAFYNRLLNYHAAHDVSYMMIDNPFVSRAGCTAFGAWGEATEGGHLITGRNFDWEAAEVFSRDRVVIMCEPDDGIPFVSLSWAAMAGVVSGMNRAGVSVTINGAPSSLPGQTATPAAMVARDVLQTAHNLDEALKILADARVFVSTLWLVGSRSDGRFVVVEKTPEVMRVRDPSGHSVVCGNHFKTPGLRDDPRNTNYLAEATSLSREERLQELLGQAEGHIGAREAVGFLRDRRLPGGVFPGHGHRGTLNALIATHATVMDLTAGVFWAASAPHQLGKFVAFDVNDFERELPAMSVAADESLATGEYESARQAQGYLRDGKVALDKGEGQTALDWAAKAEAANPGFYRNSALMGRALESLGRVDEAAKAYATALAEKPAFLSERQEFDKALKRARGGE